ncbi:neuropeptide F-like [Agrilus planipennis]|uniref:Neuropeptide F-like n=1 Tax=Agrilus planipennis TaxID=224129 RepID=A0A1W4WH22_AGRPL|nr:neuropeptide F-like [Agrilus planipennis]
MKFQAVFWLVFLTFVFITENSKAHGAPSAQSEDMLKTLLELDRMYSAVARPRFGKRTEQDTSLPEWSNNDYDNQVLKNQLINYLRK